MPDARDEDRMPPIPDGGLSESMPEWLRRPPAWRTLKDSEVVQPEPTRTASLPEADTSEIDPRTFLTDDDLPVWLRKMGPGRRGVDPAQVGDDEPVSAPESTQTSDSVAASASSSSPQVDRARSVQSPRSSPRFVPRTPPVPVATQPSPRREPAPRAPVAGTRRAEGPATPWWRGLPMILLLSLLLLVAVGVIVAMAVM